MPLLLISSLIVLMLSGRGVTASISEETISNSLSALISPNLCQLKLICAISKSENNNLQQSIFMKGISTLSDLTSKSFVGNATDALLLKYSLETGLKNRACSIIAPECPYSERELLKATFDLGIAKDNKVLRKRFKRQTQTWGQDAFYQDGYQRPYRDHYNGFYEEQDLVRQQHRRRQPQTPLRRQSSGFGMPPIFRPRDASAREVCRTCDMRGNVCSVYGIGTFIGCTGVLLIGGVPAQVACNMVTTPGSIGCGLNTMHCFMESCGLVRMSLP